MNTYKIKIQIMLKANTKKEAEQSLSDYIQELLANSDYQEHGILTFRTLNK